MRIKNGGRKQNQGKDVCRTQQRANKKNCYWYVVLGQGQAPTLEHMSRIRTRMRIPRSRKVLFLFNKLLQIQIEIPEWSG